MYSSFTRKFRDKALATGPVDLSLADTLVLGNSGDGSTPLKLLRRIEFYSSSFSGSSSFLALVLNQKCRDVTQPPFCEESYLSLRLEPSFIDKQIIHDQSGSGSNQLVYRGAEMNNDSADPRIAMDGLVFTGAEQITATTLGIEGYSLTVAAWVFFDGGHAGVLQGLVSGTGTYFAV